MYSLPGWFWSLPFSPLQESPGFLPSRAFLSPLSFRSFCLLSVHKRVFSRPPPVSGPPPSSVPPRPSAGELLPLRLRPTNVLFWFPDPASHMQDCTLPRPIRLVVLGLGVGVCGGAKGDGAPCGGLESIVSPAGITRQAAKCMPTPNARLPSRFLRSAIVISPSTRLVGFARESVPSSTLRFSLEYCVPVSLSTPPPPSPFPRTTVRVPLLSLLTEDYFCGRSALPCSAGPGRPVGCFPRLWSLSLSSPPPSLFHGHLFWVA